MIKEFLIKRPYTLLFSLASVVYVLGLFFVPLMDVDATQYASISLEMLNNGDYLQVVHHQRDYLDKPPLIFWLGALFYKMFGIHVWVYRLPSFLFTILGTYSTYRLAKLFYDEKTGLNAALIIYTTQAFFLMNHDVRTDTILTACIIFSTWQLAEFINTKKLSYVFWAFVGIGLGMLEKGPLGLAVPALAIGSHILIRREFKLIFRWEWLLGIVILGLLLMPMCIGLYQQFDLHPEKLVNGRTGVSGIKFFFWEQSFGRITGENVWKDDSTALFFTHTFVWSFLPWSLPAIIAFFSRLIQLVKYRFHSKEREFLTFGGFLLPFMALSLSHYKLPHYVFVVYPFAAIFTASWLSEMEVRSQNSLKVWIRSQQFICALILVLILGINFWFFPLYKIPLALVSAAVLLAFSGYFISLQPKAGLIRFYSFSALTAIFMNFLLNSSFYPQLLNYQGGYAASEYLKDKQIRQEICYSLNETSFALDVNTGFNWMDGTPELLKEKTEQQPELWIFTTHDGFTFLQDHYTVLESKKFEHFHVTALTLPFLNPATRQSVLEERYLARIRKK